MKKKLCDVIHQDMSPAKAIWRTLIIVEITEFIKHKTKYEEAVIVHRSLKTFDLCYMDKNHKAIIQSIEKELNLSDKQKFEIKSINKLKIVGYEN
jgi:hypothetical protein